MKPVSLEVTAKDAKRLNLPMGSIRVHELNMALNDSFLPLKKETEKKMNDIGEDAIDLMITTITQKTDEFQAYILAYRREKEKFNQKTVIPPPSPPTKRTRQQGNQDYPIAITNDDLEDLPSIPFVVPKSERRLPDVDPHQFKSMLIDIGTLFEKTNEEGRRAAFHYMVNAKKAMMKNSA